jgi:hypothetical protein
MSFLNTRQRKVVTSVALGCWLFAFFVGVIHACGLNEGIDHSQQASAIVIDCQSQGDDDGVPDCERFCANNLPVLAKLQSVQDQPGGTALPAPFLGQPFLVRLGTLPPALHRSHPPPAVALITRFVRLAL